MWSYDHMSIWPYDHIIMWSSQNLPNNWVSGSKDEMLGIVWNAFWPSSRPIGAIFGGWTDFQSLQKFRQNFHRKMKCRGSSETRFGKVWGRSEPSLRGKWPFKVCRGWRRSIFCPLQSVGDGFDMCRGFPYVKNRPAKGELGLPAAATFGLLLWLLLLLLPSWSLPQDW